MKPHTGALGKYFLSEKREGTESERARSKRLEITTVNEAIDLAGIVAFRYEPKLRQSRSEKLHNTLRSAPQRCEQRTREWIQNSIQPRVVVGRQNEKSPAFQNSSHFPDGDTFGMQPWDDADRNDKIKRLGPKGQCVNVRLIAANPILHALRNGVASGDVKHCGRRVYRIDDVAVRCQSDGDLSGAASNFEDSRVAPKTKSRDPAKSGVVPLLVDCGQKFVVGINLVPIYRGRLKVLVHLLLLPYVLRLHCSPESGRMI
jgi:hypothetical protein